MSSPIIVPLNDINVTTSGPASISYTNIPQNFDDLIIIVSGRSNSPNNPYRDIGVFAAFNNDSSTNYSRTRIYGIGDGRGTDRITNGTSAALGIVNASDATASIFGSLEILIQDYTSSNFKSWISHSANESNEVRSVTQIGHGVWRSTSAINSIFITAGDFVNFSRITFYGRKYP